MHKRSTTPPPQNGLHEEFFTNGKVAVSGHYADGVKSGEWTYYYKSGGVKARGLFVADQMHAEWKWLHEDGTLMQTGPFDHGVRTGTWRRYHPNGQIADEGAYVCEKKSGDWKTYDEKGQLIKTKKNPVR